MKIATSKILIGVNYNQQTFSQNEKLVRVAAMWHYHFNYCVSGVDKEVY